MRKELQDIENIEQYLQGKLATTDKANFESQLAESPALQSQVAFQENLMDGIERIALRSDAKIAYKSYLLKKWLMISGITLALIASAAAIVLWTADPDGVISQTQIPTVEVPADLIDSTRRVQIETEESVDIIDPNQTEIVEFVNEADIVDAPIELSENNSSQNVINEAENNDSEANAEFDIAVIDDGSLLEIILPETDPFFADANTKLNQELFELNTNRDTVIESENGIVVFIPANAFDTDQSKVDFVLQEATNPADILYAGLNTVTESGEELETGGMFYLDAFANGKRVALIKDLTVDIPSDPAKTGMQLYQGEKNESGQVLWKNPKSFVKPLSPVEITSLDFYPPDYEAKMNEWGYVNKAFLDSFYYSFQPSCNEGIVADIEDNISFDEAVGIRIEKSVEKKGKWSKNERSVMGEFVTWNFEVLSFGDEATIRMTVNQREGWSISSQVKLERAIVTPTSFTFPKNKDYDLIGKTEEIGKRLTEDGDFPRMAFVGDVVFEQKIKVNTKEPFTIDLNYEYMAVKDVVFPTVSRVVTLKINGTNEGLTCGVKPASVQTIWRPKFNNTNLATKEFEARMPWIHQSCNTAILDLYVANLHKNLAEVDALAAQELSGDLKAKFEAFAALDQGKVALNSAAQKALNAYYKTKRDALTKATKVTIDNFWKKQDLLDQEMNREVATADKRRGNISAALNRQEVAFNTNKVYSDLGMQKPKSRTNPLVAFNPSGAKNKGQKDWHPITPIRANRPILRAKIKRLGWKNVDCLMSASMNRENAKIKGNGQKSEIKYSALTLKIENAQNYENVQAYVIPKAFNSFIKISPINGKYSYKLNDNLEYQTLIIAWDTANFYAYQNLNTKSGERLISLNKTTKLEWEQSLKSALTAINGMDDEIDFLEYTRDDQSRQNKNAAKRDLKEKAKSYIFPCSKAPEMPPVDRTRLELKAPNGFSPNGDGMNDFYLIREVEQFKVFEIVISNKRGKEMFKSSDQNFKWDGTDLTGKKASEGFYSGIVYAVDQMNRAYEVKIGVNLIRDGKMD